MTSSSNGTTTAADQSQDSNAQPGAYSYASSLLSYYVYGGNDTSEANPSTNPTNPTKNDTTGINQSPNPDNNDSSVVTTDTTHSTSNPSSNPNNTTDTLHQNPNTADISKLSLKTAQQSASHQSPTTTSATTHTNTSTHAASNTSTSTSTSTSASNKNGLYPTTPTEALSPSPTASASTTPNGTPKKLSKFQQLRLSMKKKAKNKKNRSESVPYQGTTDDSNHSNSNNNGSSSASNSAHNSSKKKSSKKNIFANLGKKKSKKNENNDDADAEDVPAETTESTYDGPEFVHPFGTFTEPVPATVMMRSKTYKINSVKEKSLPVLFELCDVQCFRTEVNARHFALHEESYYAQNIYANDRSVFLLIVNLLVPSIGHSLVSSHILKNISHYNKNGTPQMADEYVFNYLFDQILNTSNSAYRDNRMKLIPRVVSGPYPVRRMVENRPVLLGNKIPLEYHRGKNYLEIDCLVDGSMVAASIIRMCHKFATKIVVDMAWCIQGETSLELPERMLCGCTVHHVDFTKTKALNTPYKTPDSNTTEETDAAKVEKVEADAGAGLADNSNDNTDNNNNDNESNTHDDNNNKCNKSNSNIIEEDMLNLT